MGSWISYGLGSENDNLPSYISLNAAKRSVYSSAFLPTEYADTPIGTNGENMSAATIRDIAGDHLPSALKRQQLDFVQQMNHRHALERSGDQHLEGVIESMELAFRMQSAAPELLDLSNETEATLQRYRVGKKLSIGTCRPTDFGRQCLLARRFAEAGVRFIELNHGGWDQHKNHRRDLKANCETTDAPIAALLEDLTARGLMDDTLVVWGGEFGRTPYAQNGDGRDHNAGGFSMWMAGGGVKGGLSYGSTDETGNKLILRLAVYLDRAPALLQSPHRHDRDPVGQSHRFDLVVRHVNHGRAQLLMKRRYLKAHLDTKSGVKVGKGLIEEEHRWFSDNRATHGDSLPLSTG